METFTVEKFAKELGLSVSLLLEQLKGAGVNKANSMDDVSEEDKSALLKYLRNMHGGSQKPKAKITLTRKQNTEIRKTDSEGRARTIQVEVRKKRTIVKPDQNKKQDSEIVDDNKSVKPKEIVDICAILKKCSIDEISRDLIKKGKAAKFPDITKRE